LKKIFFVVNHISEFKINDLEKKYLNNVDIKYGTELPYNSEKFDLIILWSYRKIITNIKNKKNIILFHSSDLPKGKGWAPIYNTIKNNNDYFVITGILASSKVDSGDIIAQAKFKMKPSYTAEILRKWDEEICLILIKDILEKFHGKEITGKNQVGEETFYERRKPDDNEIDISSKIEDLLLHIRACEENHPAYFYYKNIKYNIKIQPELTPDFPDDLKIQFFNNESN
tara:strand:- start:62 stop:745 length:684 start_codon:yes stop_codon:yes gene_type:complete